MTLILDSSNDLWIVSASIVFFALQHSLATSPGIATSSLTPPRNGPRRSALVIRISVVASTTNIMTLYYERNASTTQLRIATLHKNPRPDRCQERVKPLKSN